MGRIIRLTADGGLLSPHAILSDVFTPIWTLCFVLRSGDALMGYKKRGFGAGKVTGIGGKVEDGETVRAAAARELREEVHLTTDPADLRLVAEIDFRFPHRPDWGMPVHVFTVERWTGEATETDEISPLWLPLAGLPIERMWDDARYWLPLTLRGVPARWRFIFGADNQTVREARRGMLALGR